MPAATTKVTDVSEPDTAALIEQIKKLAVVHGKVTLSSGRTADYYVDMRRVTLDGATAPMIGRVMRDLVADWDFEAPHHGLDMTSDESTLCAAGRASDYVALVSTRTMRPTAVVEVVQGWLADGSSPTDIAVLTRVNSLPEKGTNAVIGFDTHTLLGAGMLPIPRRG